MESTSTRNDRHLLGVSCEATARVSRRLALPALLGAAIAASFARSSLDASSPDHARDMHSAPAAASPDIDAALHEAMGRMNAAMQIPSAGDPERDFARMMIAHHQGAVDMALALLQWSAARCAPGTLPGPMQRLAQAIVVEQRVEIEVMQDFLHGSAAAG
jgi:uncharacterized protein (DUF305 family)